jgi:two-component sensor histidine kinase
MAQLGAKSGEASLYGLIEIEPEPLSGLPSTAEVLVRETHHRVSNHLQILASLIGLQAHAHGFTDKPVRDALLGVRQRILAVGRLHRQLHAVTGDGSVEISGYLNRLGEDLRLCYSLEAGCPLDLELCIEAGQVTADVAMTIGLIVNELVTNAVKHAVLTVGGGILVSLDRRPDGMWRLTVRDAGPGLPDLIAHSAQKGGVGLVRTLARKLRGSISVERGPAGSAVSVIYP